MTRPYWPHSNPEPPRATSHMGGNSDFRTYEEPQAPVQPTEEGHVAVPPSGCLNGCHTGHGADRMPTETEGAARICKRCIKRLDTWLRIIPDAYALLPRVVAHGSVAGNPESAHVKRPDPPAPMRLEIVDMLDTRHGNQFDDDGQPMAGVDNRRGVFGTILAWSSRVLTERNLPRLCENCGHGPSLHRWQPPFASLCRADCACTDWAVRASVAGECALLARHLAWITEQDWVEDLYAELKALARQLGDAVGDYRPAAIGMCLAEVDAPGLDTKFLCGGALYRDQTGHGVHCAQCGDRTDVNTLRRLGLKVGIFSENGNDQLEAS